MTNPAEQTSDHTIKLVTKAECFLAKLLFEERSGLSESFASHFGIKLAGHDAGAIYFSCDQDTASNAKRGFEMLVGAMAGGDHIDKKLIKKTAQEIYPDSLAPKFKQAANQNTSQKLSAFVSRSEKQTLQAKLIDENDIIFSIGPAGTGKTHVAMVKAVQALKEKKVKKILLTRPAAAAGEDLGFLPGSKDDKMAPYMRPLYDALDKEFGPGKYKQMLEEGSIEIAPIGFMRGRTFEDSFIVIDEAQNCTMEHLKMAITRLGPNSKMVITGDPEQVDLQPKSLSGLKPMFDKLQGVEGIAMQFYGPEDVVRHPTVKRVIDRLEGETVENQPVKSATPGGNRP